MQFSFLIAANSIVCTKMTAIVITSLMSVKQLISFAMEWMRNKWFYAAFSKYLKTATIHIPTQWYHKVSAKVWRFPYKV